MACSCNGSDAAIATAASTSYGSQPTKIVYTNDASGKTLSQEALTKLRDGNAGAILAAARCGEYGALSCLCDPVVLEAAKAILNMRGDMRELFIQVVCGCEARSAPPDRPAAVVPASHTAPPPPPPPPAPPGTYGYGGYSAGDCPSGSPPPTGTLA